MYVLISANTVINGPKPWSPKSFTNTLKNELNIDYVLPLTKTDNLPISITESVKILPAELDYSTTHNPKTQYLHGPFWDFSNDFATGTFIAQDYSVEFVKGALIAKIADSRYNREISGCNRTLQNTSITVDTSREGRNVYIQKYLLMADGETIQWKFPEGWFTITKAELGEIVTCVNEHIQSEFDWESNTSSQILSATTLSELDQIIVE